MENIPEPTNSLSNARERESNPAAGESADTSERLQFLEKELEARTDERDALKSQLELIEKQLVESQAKCNVTTTSSNKDQKKQNKNQAQLENDNKELRQKVVNLDTLIQEKVGLCQEQEKQNAALKQQIKSLKEVVSITKDLLNIRNMEVDHLQKDVDSMEEKISNERKRQQLMLLKMDEASKLNSQLRKEYETQLQLFRGLKQRYDEKMTYLTNENQKLTEEFATLQQN